MINKIKKIIRKKFVVKEIPVNIPIYEGNILAGKTALITGGGSGIGKAMAEAFVRQGAKKVIITGRCEENLRYLSNEWGTKIEYVICDLAELDRMEDMFNDVLEKVGGHLDILVNNAGYHGNQSFGMITEKDYNNTFDINQKAVFFLSQTVFQYYKKKGIQGNILIISSASSIKPAWSPYEISKWSVRGFTRGLAREGVEYGITVNGIAPGPTATSMSNINVEAEGLRTDYLPIKRWIMPEEIANLAVFMVSDMGRCVIGDTIFLDGGSGNITINK